MFELDSKYKLQTKIPIIVKDYKPLLSDGEDVLFIGKNYLGDHVLGSVIDEDYEEKIIYYFQLVIDGISYLDFTHKKISYLDLLKRTDEVFIVLKNFDREIVGIYLYPLNVVPVDYLPLEGSFCPEIEEKFELNFAIRFTGKLADLRMALIEELTQTQTAFGNLLSKALDVVKDLKLNPQIYQVALDPKSIRIGYNIKFDKELFPTDDTLARYLTSFLEYSITKLPDDTESLLENDQTSNSFLVLEKEIERVYENASKSIPENIHDKLKNELIKGINDIDELSENLGSSYDEIEVYKSFDDDANCFGIINDEYREKIGTAVEKIESKNDKMVEDSDYKEYEIYIYHLNTETRSGNAIIVQGTGDDRVVSKPRIKISGDNPLEETKYAESLYHRKFIKVSGKAKKIGDNYRSILIEF